MQWISSTRTGRLHWPCLSRRRHFVSPSPVKSAASVVVTVAVRLNVPTAVPVTLSPANADWLIVQDPPPLSVTAPVDEEKVSDRGRATDGDVTKRLTAVQVDQRVRDRERNRSVFVARGVCG